jgi:hypothetical protein
MFPSRRYLRFSTALLEVAEAMLRPVSADDVPAVGDDSWQWPARGSDTRPTTAVHPHRRGIRLDRPRRPGTPAAPAHPCSSPVTPRITRDARPGAARAAAPSA